MKSAIVLVVAAFTAVAMSSVIPNGEISPNLRFLAVADGKAYFADSSELRNWDEAKQFCEDLGMRLAVVENNDQYYGLRAAYNETTFVGHFWTAGRDALKRTQFVWDSDATQKAPLPSEVEWFFYTSPNFQFQTCVHFHHLVSHALLSPDLCSVKKQTMCEVDSVAK